MAAHEFVATTSRGAEPVLAGELASLGMADVHEDRGAVTFSGDLAQGYRACLWSRVASRVLLVLRRFETPDAEAFYEGVRSVRWRGHLLRRRTFAVACVGRSAWLRNTHFGALRAKDAVVDRMRHDVGARPDVDPHDPDLRLHAHVTDAGTTLSLDLSGPPLHERGLGRATRAAPLKENLAATLLLLAGWPEAGWEGRPLVDPMCGSGTLLTEAAWMARDVAPGLRRPKWGFEAWAHHDRRAWKELVAEANERRAEGRSSHVALFGSDIDGRAVEATRINAERAGVRSLIKVQTRALAETAPPGDVPPGLVLTNPPYGHRIGDKAAVREIVGELGDVLRRRFLGWEAWVFVSHEMAKSIGLRPATRVPLFNGPLDCRLLHLPISATPTVGRPGWRD